MKKSTITQKFQQNWQKFAPQFGTKQWEENPDFLYFIEAPLPKNLWPEMEQLSENLQQIKKMSGIWFPPENMHITLALPGRKGVHFQAHEVSTLKKTIERIVREQSSFSVTLGHLNCFADVLFREVWDKEEKLFSLHKKFCEEIPFAQDPEYKMKNYLPHISLFLGKGDPAFFEHPKFSRELPPLEMKVEKIVFGQARDESGKYNRKILKEFSLT